MTHLLYITADEIGANTGGGKVTAEELAALRGLGDVTVLRPASPLCGGPFEEDLNVLWQCQKLSDDWAAQGRTPKLAHVYAGCFGAACNHLRRLGVKITYTVAAHGVPQSRQAHEDVGAPFPYAHLTDPEQFAAYNRGYRALADVVICPSTHSERIVREEGRAGPVVVIPHGVHLPPRTRLPDEEGFVVGYLGAPGPDKGLVTLARAWARFSEECPEARLLLAGRYSEHLRGLFELYGASRHVEYVGWVERLDHFYDHLHVYVQPSTTEGFGLEVTEAMSYARPVLCSTGAGACDLVPEAWTFPARDHASLVFKLGLARMASRAARTSAAWHARWRGLAEEHTWAKVRARYQELWRSLL